MDSLLKRAMPSASHVKAVLSATAEMGAASGLEIAVKVLRALADDPENLTPAEVRAAATSLERSADKKRTAAKAVLAKY